MDLEPERTGSVIRGSEEIERTDCARSSINAPPYQGMPCLSLRAAQTEIAQLNAIHVALSETPEYLRGRFKAASWKGLCGDETAP